MEGYGDELRILCEILLVPFSVFYIMTAARLVFHYFS
jgi:hypothetical protein